MTTVSNLCTANTVDDDTYLDIFQDSYAAVQTHVRTSDGFFVSGYMDLETSELTGSTAPSSSVSSIKHPDPQSTLSAHSSQVSKS